MSTHPNMRRALLILAAVLGLLVLLIELATFIPSLPLLGAIGTIITACFSLHVSLAACLAILMAFAAMRSGASRGGKLLLYANACLLVLSLVPIGLLIARAHESSASISWWSHLRVRSSANPVKTSSFQYASMDGKPLFLDVYPSGTTTGRSATVVMIHGGGFAYGKRSDGRDWDQWFAARGYTVFDVDYRLAPPVRWNVAAADVACALTYIRSHAEEWHLDAGRLLIVGQSAGASVALQVAYGLHDGTLQPSCGGEAPHPTAVFAIYPVEDFTLAWNEDLKLGPLTLRRILTDYIGGSPKEFPDRYRFVSPADHIAPGLPPTLIAYGNHDHVVPVDGHGQFAEKLKASGVPIRLIEIPWGDHGYDLAWGSLGGQITRHDLVEFLGRHFPASPTGTQP